MKIKPTHDEIVERAVYLLHRARERGIRTRESDHVPSGACQQFECVENHHLGMSRNTAETFSGSDWLEGQNFEVFGLWNIHGAKYDRIWAYFPGVLGSGHSVDVTQDVLSQT